MSKGEKLGKLLDKGNIIQQQMDAIFKQYNVRHLDLKSLPAEGRKEWNQLFKQKDEITEQIGKLFK